MPKMNAEPEFPPGTALPPDFFEEEEEGSSVSLFGVGSIFLRNIRLVLILPLLAFVLVAVHTAMSDTRYSATSKLALSGGEQGGGAQNTGLMSQLGQLVSGGGGASPDFYAALVNSGPLTREAARDTYEITVDGVTRSGTVAELYGNEPATPASNVKISQGLIASNLTARVEPGTGFVVLQTMSPWPELAVAVNRRLLELVNEFNIEQRQARASTERQFVEERLAEAAASLEAAERELQRFLEANQRYQESPRLAFEANRLERRADLQQRLYVSLAQAYEQARINEVRNTPVATVVNWPEETLGPEERRSPLVNGFLAFVVALLLVAGLVLARVYLERYMETHPDDYEEFRGVARSRFGELIPRGVRERLPGGRSSAHAVGNGRPGGEAGGPGEPSERNPKSRELDPAGKP